MVGVGRHQSLLDCEHEIMSGLKGGRGHRWIAPAESQVQRMNRFAEAKWGFDLIVKAQGLDVV
jgi:oligoribonuclease NrnB/cAMP/cGMP phosphodiesterase (DHH superfamily)